MHISIENTTNSKTKMYIPFIAVFLIALLTQTYSFGTESKPHHLSGTEWDLVNITSMNDEVNTPTKNEIFILSLDENGRFKATTQCLKAKGQWISNGNAHIEFNQISMENNNCSPHFLEKHFINQFQWVRSYILREDKLFLATMADGAIIELEHGKKNPSYPFIASENGGPLSWQIKEDTQELALHENQSVDSRVILNYPQSTILDNLGCQQIGETNWCYVQKLGGGPVGFVVADHLKPAISPAGNVINGPDDSALRAGQGDFDATGSIPCSVKKSQSMTQCAFGVSRMGGGYATVVITKPDNRQRMLYFRFGVAIGAGTAEADNPGEFSVTKENDLFLINLGSEKYEVPEAIIFGG